MNIALTIYIRYTNIYHRKWLGIKDLMKLRKKELNNFLTNDSSRGHTH